MFGPALLTDPAVPSLEDVTTVPSPENVPLSTKVVGVISGGSFNGCPGMNGPISFGGGEALDAKEPAVVGVLTSMVFGAAAIANEAAIPPGKVCPDAVEACARI
jgi:hypothetical protein